MDPSIILTGAMTLLKPLLEKAGEKAAETIGEKLAEKTVEKSLWKQIKSLFIIEEEKESIENIENKQVANNQDIAMIEDKLKTEISNNPGFIDELKASLNINSFNQVIISEKIASVQRLQNEIMSLEKQMERAGVATSGDYMNKIELQTSKIYYQISEISNILNSK